MNDANTTQVGGGHYKGTTYQHWDFVICALDGRYLEGNITKYVARWRKKNGLEDLRKARHYLTKLIEEYNIGNVKSMTLPRWMGSHQSPAYFCDVNGIDVTERMIILGVSGWANREDLHRVGATLDALIEKQEYAEEDQRPAEVFDPSIHPVEGEPDGRYVDQG